MKLNDLLYKNANLPPHCGNCKHLQWDEDGARCLNPHFAVDEDDLNQEIMRAEEPANAHGIIELLMEDAFEGDHHDYSGLCAMHTKSEAEAKRVRDDFAEQVGKEIAERIKETK